MRYIKVVLLVLIFFFFAIFVAQNHGLLGQDISFRLDLFVIPPLESIPMPLYFVMLIALVLGALVCVLFLAGDRIKMTFAMHRANKRINLLEQEVASLRALPLTGEYKTVSDKIQPVHSDGKPAPSAPAAMTSAAEAAALPESEKAENIKETNEGESSDSVAKL